MAGRLIGPGRGVALIAACMFVLQSVVGALAGEVPVPRHVDSFGNPICVADTIHSGTQHGSSGHDILPVCCVLGCAESAWLPDAPCDSAPIRVTLRSRGGTVLRSAEVSVRRGDRDPGSPRGPPSAA